MTAPPCDPDALARAAALLAGARRVVALTGAGISAESGVPTFRGAEGLWRTHDPMQLATPKGFQRRPRDVWAWYRWRQALVRRCAPNAGHAALVRLEDRLGDGFTLVTQNVDGLHARAGSRRVYELHGNLFRDRCTQCQRGVDVSGAPDVPVDPDDPTRDPPLPACGACGGLLRPGVVWFREALPMRVLEAAEEAVAHGELLLVIGTSGVVYPAAGLAGLARRAGGRVVVINPEPTPHGAVADVVLQGGAGAVLGALVGE